MLTFASVALTAASVEFWRWRIGGDPDPLLGDGEEYCCWRLAPRPFCWRWLVPVLTGGRVGPWVRIMRLALIASGPALVGYLQAWGATPLEALAGVALWCLLPGLWERHGQVAYLVDALATTAALVAATGTLPPVVRVAAALVAGGTRETAPVLAAAMALDPLPLVGLLAVPWWRTGGAPWRHEELYTAPWRTFARLHRARGWNLNLHVIPWGGAIAGFATTDPRVWLTVAVAALPIVRSIDTVRLYTQGAAPVIAAAVIGTEPGVLVALVLWSLITSSNWQA